MSRDLAPDWILKQTLEVQRQASMAWKGGAAQDSGDGSSSLTLSVLGCGTMGIAILGGIFDSLNTSSAATDKSSTSPDAANTTSGGEPAPARLLRKFHACVRSRKGADRVRAELGKYGADLHVHESSNLPAVRDADVVLLACKPYMVAGILSGDEMRAALAGKVLVSICAGVPEAQIHDALYGSSVDLTPKGKANKCVIVRAMPNTAAAVRESMTVIGTSEPPLEHETSTLIDWIFTRVGRVVHLPPANMDVCTALCGSGPAFVAVMVESMAAGAIAMGLPRDEAYTMAAQTMRGTTALLLGGEHPAVLRDKVTTPGGCTIGGLLVLEEGSVRGTVARAVREATVVASQLGQGKQGVNGTRF